MKRFAILLVFVFGLIASTVRAEEEISFDFFYNALSPMGEWSQVDGYGYVWHPADVDADWAPYTDGYWSYTDAGWTWVSYEDWGGITYHYGRWVLLEDYGWCWVPEYEWGPAWVSWRQSDDYVGWAPLPPEATWEEDRGIGVWVDTSYDIGPGYYSFCHVRDFGAPVLRHVIVPRSRNITICFSTRNITRICYNTDFGCVFNGCFDYDYIVSRCERPIPALRLVFNRTNVFIRGDRHQIFLNGPRGNALVVGNPRRAERDYRNFSHRELVTKSFDKSRVVRGWHSKDKDQDDSQARLLAKMRAETKGLSPQTSRIRPVRQEAVAKVLPEKVDFKARPVALQKVADRAKPNTAVVNPNDPRRNDDKDQPGARGNNRDGVVNKRAVADDKNQPGGRNPRVRPDDDDRNPAADTADKPNRRPGQPNADRPGREEPGLRPGGTDGPRVVDRPGNDADRGKPGTNRGNAERDPRNPVADTDKDPVNDGRERNRLIKERDAASTEARRRAAEAEDRKNMPDANPARDAARDAAARKAKLDEDAARKNAESNQAEREAARRNAGAARERAADADQARDADEQKKRADAARRGAAEAANEKRAAEMQDRQAEAARQRAADAAKDRNAEAQRDQAEAARQRAVEANRQRAADAQQKQAEAARERAAEANRDRAAAQRQQQDAARERAADAARDRADAQRQQQAEAARERAAEANRERAAAAQRQQEAARERAADAARERAADAARERAADAARERAASAAREAEARQRAAEAAKKRDDDDNNKRSNGRGR